MKVKCLVRNPDDYLRETKKDIFKMPRNYNSDLHPLAVPREYTRAVNAAKLSRMFAKPFVGSLDGHSDTITAISRHNVRLSHVYTGAADGELRLWDLMQMNCVRRVSAHAGIVRGICHTTDGSAFLTVGDDKTIKRWHAGPVHDDDVTANAAVSTIALQSLVTSISHAVARDEYATCGDTCHVWREERSQPTATFSWGVDSLHCVRYSPIETHMLAACASDRSVILYDTRQLQPLRRVISKMRNNSLAWNPMEAYMFTTANDDYNLYTWDMRVLSHPLLIHRDHVSAVIDLDFSPTGREFVSGSYDCTLRIFGVTEPRSRDIYHTRRMQRITCVCWSADDGYVLSASDEMNVRLWRAQASAPRCVLKHRQQQARRYHDRLLDKFGQHPHVRRVLRHRHVPRHVRASRREHTTSEAKRRRKLANRRANSRAGTVPCHADVHEAVVDEKQ